MRATSTVSTFTGCDQLRWSVVEDTTMSAALSGRIDHHAA
jgi:hypothetical protein